MRVRSSFVIALLVFAAGACAVAPDGGAQPASVAPATTTSARAGTAMNRPTGDAPPGLLAVARRKPAPPLRVTAFDGRMVSLGFDGGTTGGTLAAALAYLLGE